MAKNNERNYTASDIKVLEGLEPVRLRPGMYIGSTGLKGLHHLVYEVVDNSVDEALAGVCDTIIVNIYKDGSLSVMDNGSGIPVEKHPQTGKSTLETVLTILHAGGKFNHSAYQVSGGLHGVGVSVVNALSEWLEATVYRDGNEYIQTFARGKVTSELKIIGETDKRGTKIKFKPDDEIFESTIFDKNILINRFREMAFLNKGIKIVLNDERDDSTQEFYYEGGIIQFVEYLNRNKSPLHEEVFYFEDKKDDSVVEIAMQYTDSYNENVLTFANNIQTSEGGTHLSGFRTALTRALNDYGRKFNLIKENDPNLQGEDTREGLTSVVTIKLPNPQFEGQTKGKLGNSESRGIVESLLYENLSSFLEENPGIGRIIISKAQSSARAREAARKARDLTRKRSILDKILNSDEIKNMITAFGTGIGEDFNIDKLRYGKIIIMTDADVDGAHIRTLLLTFFYRYMKPLIEKGHVYIAQPPLYGIVRGTKVLAYAYDDEELTQKMKEIGGKNLKIQRYKGLGEMNADQLWYTTMDPEHRVILRVSLDEEDNIVIDETFTMLMGDKVEPRREFIEENAIYVENIDA